MFAYQVKSETMKSGDASDSSKIFREVDVHTPTVVEPADFPTRLGSLTAKSRVDTTHRPIDQRSRPRQPDLQPG